MKSFNCTSRPWITDSPPLSIILKNSNNINFDNIVKVSSTFVVKDFPKIVKPTNVVYKECILAKKNKYHSLARSPLPHRSWRLFT